MTDRFEKDFYESIDALRFSSGEKERLFRKTVQASVTPEERKAAIMKKNNFRRAAARVAAIAVICLMATGVTAFAASKIVSYVASSDAKYDYTTVNDISDARLEDGSGNTVVPDFPEKFAAGYTFDGGNRIKVAGKDEADNTVEKWTDLMGVYKGADGKEINLTMSCKTNEEEARDATESREIDGITVLFNRDEHLFLQNEAEEPDAEIREREANDSHFFVSYGDSDKVGTCFFNSVSFEKDGISYLLSSFDDVPASELFSMAEELIRQ